MPISNDSMNKDLYKFLRTKGFDPVPKDSDGQTIPVPDEAEVRSEEHTSELQSH